MTAPCFATPPPACPAPAPVVKVVVRVPFALMVEEAEAEFAVVGGAVMADTYNLYAMGHQTEGGASFIEYLRTFGSGELLFNLHWINLNRSVKFSRLVADSPSYLLAETIPTAERCTYSLRPHWAEHERYDALLEIAVASPYRRSPVAAEDLYHTVSCVADGRPARCAYVLQKCHAP